MIIKCRENDYQRLIRIFHKMKEKPYEFVPTRWDLEKYIIPNLNKWIIFLLWIKEMGIETTENKVIRNDICKLIDTTLVIVPDNQEDSLEDSSEGE